MPKSSITNTEKELQIVWENLSTTKKLLFIALMCLIAPFAPEFIFLADLGGIELVFSFLVLYYKPLIIKLKNFIERLRFEVDICVSAFKNSSLLKPKVYFTQAAFYTCAFVVFGSTFYASFFLLPAMLLNTQIV